MKEQQIDNYGKHYSDSGFFSKIAKYAKFLGKGVLTKIFTLYYVFKDKTTPDWAKATIAGTLGYLILPVDLIPDLIPIAGFSDDIATIFASVNIILSYIKPEHKYFADLSVRDIFNNK